MRLDRLTPAHVRRAVDVYIDLAWPEDQPQRPRITSTDLETAQTLEELRPFFETPRGEDHVVGARYALRLGNCRYPFMKLVVQEYLVAGEFFFSVDTHDDLAIGPDNPDYEGWCEVREFNRQLKERIEDAWERAELPTHADLQGLMEGIAKLEPGGAARGRLVLADDERHIADGLGAVLRARGYEVTLAYDGKAVLAALELGPRPDLVILDFSMPELDGRQVLEALENEPRWADLTVLLATATDIDLGRMRRARAVLRKPYPREVLFRMIEELVAASRAEAQGDGAGSQESG